MSTSEEKELKDLRLEVTSLRSEVKELREFVKALYAMLNEGEEYQSDGDYAGVEYGRANT